MEKILILQRDSIRLRGGHGCRAVLFFNTNLCVLMMKHSVFMFVAALILASCATRGRLTYFRDMDANSVVAMPVPRDIMAQAGDRIAIVVTSRDRNLAALFNISGTCGSADSSGGSAGGDARGMVYTVDRAGNIDFPVMGALHVEGLTRDSIAKYVKRQLIDRRLLTDAVVTVELRNLCVSVLGEVRSPGRVPIDRDCFTLIDALSAAGDLTTSGDRRDVLVMRTEGGVRRAYRVNLNSAAEVYSSPAYYLSQGDVVYVKPLRAKRGK